tara:strand:- start:342 stop:989 length:648 start_codon:yes stop_codon:yes gene_type:complete
MSKTTIPAGGIADSAVTTAKINADAITGAKIADDAINSEHFTDGSIDTVHIGDSQVTAAKVTGLTTGKILQVQSMTTSTQTETTSSSFSDTAIRDSITPSASDSKIMIIITDSCQITMASGSVDNGMGFRLKRVSGDTTVVADNNSYEGFYHGNHTGSNPNFRHHITLTAIDSPNTTSEVEYVHQINVYRGSSNGKARSVHDSNRGNMILLEIGA